MYHGIDVNLPKAASTQVVKDKTDITIIISEKE